MDFFQPGDRVIHRHEGAATVIGPEAGSLCDGAPCLVIRCDSDGVEVSSCHEHLRHEDAEVEKARMSALAPKSRRSKKGRLHLDPETGATVWDPKG